MFEFSSYSWWQWILLVIVILILLVMIFRALVITKENTRIVIERFGKFSRIAKPGLSLRIPILESESEPISLRNQELILIVKTKTKDNIFVRSFVSIQYRVIKEEIYKMYYTLTDFDDQMDSYASNTVRSQIPTMTLDEAFEGKDRIAEAIRNDISKLASNFGYEILGTLVTEIKPNRKVVKAISRAKAEELQGIGIANQQNTVLKGLEESISNFVAKNPGTNSSEIIGMVTLTNYFDSMEKIASASETNTIYLPNSPAGVNDMRNAFITSQKPEKESKKKKK